MGRSNVGKSSLLNALANRTGLAHVSKTPGRTRLLNCFAFEEAGLGDATLVDCPGYGFAKAPQKMRAGWQQMIEGYLLGREELVSILVLVDGAVGPTPLDVQMVEWLEHHERPHAVVATKHDKVKASVRDRRKRDLAAGLRPRTRGGPLDQCLQGRQRRPGPRPGQGSARPLSGRPPTRGGPPRADGARPSHAGRPDPEPHHARLC